MCDKGLNREVAEPATLISIPPARSEPMLLIAKPTLFCSIWDETVDAKDLGF